MSAVINYRIIIILCGLDQIDYIERDKDLSLCLSVPPLTTDPAVIRINEQNTSRKYAHISNIFHGRRSPCVWPSPFSSQKCSTIILQSLLNFDFNVPDMMEAKRG